MSPTFPPARKRSRGYDRSEVDEFLDRARRAYDEPDTVEPSLTASQIRHMSFGLTRGGYSTTHVDAALERLEDAFALRERERALQSSGKSEWLQSARQTAQVILNRLTRPAGRRFARAGFLTQGYNCADVDALADRLVDYFQTGKPIGIDRVRTAVFRPQRGGYREAQVDLVLDAVVDVMLAVR
ncbi:hypothetical protein GCM10027416_14000 [Okibacterium endophyticum]